jgi:hypothetical protein
LVDAPVEKSFQSGLVWNDGEYSNLRAIQSEGCGYGIIERANPIGRLRTVEQGFHKRLRRDFRNLAGILQELHIIHAEIVPRGYHNMSDTSLLNEAQCGIGVGCCENTSGFFEAFDIFPIECAESPYMAVIGKLGGRGGAGENDGNAFGAGLDEPVRNIAEQERGSTIFRVFFRGICFAPSSPKYSLGMPSRGKESQSGKARC